MEKRKPQYRLEEIKERIQQGDYRVTLTALNSASQDFGFIKAIQVADFVLKLESKRFYKSMTTLQDNKI